MTRLVVLDTCLVINLRHIQRPALLNGLRYSPLTTVFVRMEFERGRPESLEFFLTLIETGRLKQIRLEVEDLVDMASVPQSRRASDAELSCFVVARRLGCRVITDDGRAIKFLCKHLTMDPKHVKQTADILLEAFETYILSEYELREIQEILARNQFRFPFDLVEVALSRRLMSAPDPGGYAKKSGQV